MFVSIKSHLRCSLPTGFLQEKASFYAEFINGKGAPIYSFFGFVDCTKINICRFGGNGSLQSSVYSWNKRMHWLVYQTITTPDSIIFSFYGLERKRHDITLLRHSGIISRLQEFLIIDGMNCCIYGDKAYMLSPWMQIAFDLITVTPEQSVFNTEMSAFRVFVDWNYKYLK